MTCKACSGSPIPGTVWRKLSLGDGWGSEVKCDECDGTGEVMPLDEQAIMLRAALARMVGVDTREELEQMELVMRAMPVPSEDKAAMLDAIHALLATLPTGTTAQTEGK